MKKLILFFSIFACIMTACISSGSKSGASVSTKSNPETEAMLDGSWTTTKVYEVDEDEDFYYWEDYSLFLDKSNHNATLTVKDWISVDDSEYSLQEHVATIIFKGKWYATADVLYLNLDKKSLTIDIVDGFYDYKDYSDYAEDDASRIVDVWSENDIRNVTRSSFDMPDDDLGVIKFVRPEDL